MLPWSGSVDFICVGLGWGFESLVRRKGLGCSSLPTFCSPQVLLPGTGSYSAKGDEWVLGDGMPTLPGLWGSESQ